LTGSLAIDTELPKTGKRVGIFYQFYIMKLIFACVLIVFFSAFSLNKYSPAYVKNQENFLKLSKEEVDVAIKKKVNVTITSTNGCSVHIVGIVTFTIFPPEITDFDGTVTISGAGHCPNVTLTFKRTAGEDLQITPNSDDPCSVTDVTWSGSNNDVVNILNEQGVRNVVIQELQSVCQ
jgi:hypothetical protein